jgi:hypothetical protein
MSFLIELIEEHAHGVDRGVAPFTGGRSQAAFHHRVGGAIWWRRHFTAKKVLEDDLAAKDPGNITRMGAVAREKASVGEDPVSLAVLREDNHVPVIGRGGGFQFGLGASVRYRIRDVAAFGFTVGGGGANIRVQGQAAPPNLGSSEIAHPALVYGSLDGRWYPTPRLFLGARFHVAHYLPALRIHFGQDVVAERALMMTPEGVIGVALY